MLFYNICFGIGFSALFFYHINRCGDLETKLRSARQAEIYEAGRAEHYGNQTGEPPNDHIRDIKIKHENEDATGIRHL